MPGANKVIINTLLLYGKTAFTLLLSLYTTRIILQALGAEDFGLFNVIGGLVAMFSFLNAAMSAATQRYISFNKGTDDLKKVKRIFSNSIILHYSVAIIVLLMLEVGGIYFLNHSLQIPFGKLDEARSLYHFVVATAFVTIISVPYDALLNANENIKFLVITNIAESVLKLLAAFYISYIYHDKLFIYGLTIFIIALIIMGIKRIYIKIKYEESKVVLRQEYEYSTIKELTLFAFWNLFGAFSYLGRTQGLAILFNIFFGIIINAAYAISTQVSAQINIFSLMMLQALNPQIMKSEGGKDRQKMLALAFMASKFGFLLLALIALPVIFEMQNILSLWLVEVPSHTSEICIFVLVALMVNQLTIGIDSAIQAGGNIKKYMFVVGSFKLSILPVAFVILKAGYPMHLVFYAYILLESLAGAARLFILKLKMDVSILNYFSQVIIKVIPVIIVVGTINYLIISYIDFPSRFMLTAIVSFIMFIITSYFFSFTIHEKKIIRDLLLKTRSKFAI